jgi:lipopolysaccharide export system protein LptA
MNCIRQTADGIAIGAFILILSMNPALAERADRDKPMNLEANRITIDDGKKIQTFEGNVQLIQGTIVIHAEKIVVSQDTEGFQRGTALGGGGRLATFRQKREGKEEYIDGEAERIEYYGRANKVELFGHARVKSGLDEVQGQYISYDGNTENYLVSGGPTDSAKGGKTERVKAVIQPKQQRESGKPAVQ